MKTIETINSPAFSLDQLASVTGGGAYKDGCIYGQADAYVEAMRLQNWGDKLKNPNDPDFRSNSKWSCRIYGLQNAIVGGPGRSSAWWLLSTKTPYFRTDPAAPQP